MALVRRAIHLLSSSVLDDGGVRTVPPGSLSGTYNDLVDARPRTSVLYGGIVYNIYYQVRGARLPPHVLSPKVIIQQVDRNAA